MPQLCRSLANVLFGVFSFLTYSICSDVLLLSALVISIVISEAISLVVSVAVSAAAACSVLYGAYTVSLCELSAVLLAAASAAVATAVVSAVVTSIVTSAVTSVAAAITTSCGNILYLAISTANITANILCYSNIQCPHSNTILSPAITILNTNILQPRSNNI